MASFKICKLMNISMKDEMVRDGNDEDLINLELLKDTSMTSHTSLDYPTICQNLMSSWPPGWDDLSEDTLNGFVYSEK